MKQGEESSKILRDSLLSFYKKEHKVDTFPSYYPEMLMSTLLKDRPETRIYIENKNDTIWKYTKQKGVMIGDYLRISKDSGFIYYHAKFDKNIVYRKFNVFENSQNYDVELFKKDKKTIKGISCFKLILKYSEGFDDDIFPVKSLTYTYEMYVTDKIDFPIYSVLYFNNEKLPYFPMEINITDNFFGNFEKYELLSIE